MSEEGKLWAYDTAVGDLSLNFHSLLSLSLSTCEGGQSYMGDISNNNTPRMQEFSGQSKNVSGSNSERSGCNKKKSHSALVFVQLIWSSLEVCSFLLFHTIQIDYNYFAW